MKPTTNLYQEHKLIEFRVKFQWNYKIFYKIEKKKPNYFKNAFINTSRNARVLAAFKNANKNKIIFCSRNKSELEY